MGGGVSNAIFMVHADGSRMVVKQALPRLRVQREWLADPERTLTEGDALIAAHRIAPHGVPEVLDLDRENVVLVIQAAPITSRDWKQRLLSGEIQLAVAQNVGALLARLHSERRGLDRFDRWEAFEQLRVRPYFRTLMEDDPALAPLVGPAIETMLLRRQSLVHGDVSPKNVLIGPATLWLIDFEVAHLGDPAFDIAFMLCHLSMKAIHMPPLEARFREVALAFLDAYRSAGGVAPEDQHLTTLLGCLLLARVKGRSPSGYLTVLGEQRAWNLGLELASSRVPVRSLFGEPFRV